MSGTEPDSLFGEFYYAHNCGAPYERSEAWLAFFDRIAERIVSDLNPHTVLDAGCAKGFLVERLRAHGVEAWGIDVSEYAIQSVHADIKPYCWIGSITQPLPQHYDLIVSIEVIEHIPPAESIRALENLCRHTDDLLISTSVEDYKEATHLNLQPLEYWARNFARYDFYHDVDFDASFITPWAARYHRQSTPQPAVQAYERKLQLLSLEVKELRSNAVEAHKTLQGSNYQDLRQQIRDWEARWNDLECGATWQLLKKVQGARMTLVPPGSRRERLLNRLRGRSADPGPKPRNLR